MFFKQRLDMMDVEEMLEKMNRNHSSPKPFTSMEITILLKRLNDEGRIFLVEDEGKMGVVYAV